MSYIERKSKMRNRLLVMAKEKMLQTIIFFGNKNSLKPEKERLSRGQAPEGDYCFFNINFREEIGRNVVEGSITPDLTIC